MMFPAGTQGLLGAKVMGVALISLTWEGSLLGKVGTPQGGLVGGCLLTTPRAHQSDWMVS